MSTDQHLKPRVLNTPKGGAADELQHVKGIGQIIEAKLNELGIFHYGQIASWRAEEIAWIDNYLQFKGRILREEWIRQAKILMKEFVQEI